jgi:hypothetical protein
LTRIPTGSGSDVRMIFQRLPLGSPLGDGLGNTHIILAPNSAMPGLFSRQGSSASLC